MNENCDICQFLQAKPLKNQVITTEHWTVGVILDQPYLGRALITLLTHKESLGQLSPEEWNEFELIMQKLEPAYEAAFGAMPLNIGNFMNHGFRDDPPHPHVHWQVFPRYKNIVKFAGMTFEDRQYGSFYDDSATRPVDVAVAEKIAEELKANLN